MQVLKWILALAVGGFLIAFGAMKFIGGAFIFPYIEYKATALGFPMAEMFFPLVNYVVGALEITAGVLTVLPMTRKFGSTLALAPFLGAIVFHLSPLLGVTTTTGYADPAPEAALAAGGPFAATDFSPETSTMLFMMAAVMFLVALMNAFLQRNS